MEKVGVQANLPLRSAMRIALQGIRIRLGRSLVTLSGVALGIAFLMSNITAQLIRDAISRERETRQTVNLMEAVVRGEIGSFDGKTVAVAVFGTLTPAERALLERLASARVRLRGTEVAGMAIEPVRLEEAGRDAAVWLVLGDVARSTISLNQLAAGMTVPVVIDSVTERKFPGEPALEIRRESFFSQATEEQVAKLQKKAREATFRTIWIAVISILVTVIGIANALLMSVTERFREIGTMKCLGALSNFIRQLFLFESALIGFCGAVLGMVAGGVLPILVFGFSFGFMTVLGQMNFVLFTLLAIGAIVVGTILAMLAAIYPANFAARMVPATALRTNI